MHRSQNFPDIGFTTLTPAVFFDFMVQSEFRHLRRGAKARIQAVAHQSRREGIDTGREQQQHGGERCNVPER